MSWRCGTGDKVQYEQQNTWGVFFSASESVTLQGKWIRIAESILIVLSCVVFYPKVFDGAVWAIKWKMSVLSLLF